MARRSADGYQVVELSDFGGLDLRRDPQDASPIRAIDMLNVELENDGRIRSRAGTSKSRSRSSTTSSRLQWTSFAVFVPGGTADPQVITVSDNGGSMIAWAADGSGSGVAELNPSWWATAPSDTIRINASVMIGDPDDTPLLYINLTASGTGSKLIKYDGTNFTETAISGGAKHMAVQYPDNRLVLANSGIVDTQSRVVFSAPNDPETFDLANNYVDLLPGDGEQIVGLANFREFLFAFKESKFFRFYGNSVDDQGGTVFNYQTVYHNLATPAYAIRVCASGREGVYFLAKDGIYLTDGGYPRKVSAALDPLFRGADDAGYFTGASSIGGSSDDLALYYVDGRLYLTLGDNTMFVFDPSNDAWMYWGLLDGRSATIRAIAPVLLAGGDREVPYFLTTRTSGSSTESCISYLDPTSIYDQEHSVSVTLGSYYRTNFLDLGTPGAEKVVRQIELEGYLSGKTVGLYGSNGDTSTGLGASGSVTTTALNAATPTWPAYEVGQGRLRKASRARNFSLGVGLDTDTGSTSWVLHRAMLHLRGQRPAGIKSA